MSITRTPAFLRIRLGLSTGLLPLLLASVGSAADPKYIVVRLDEVRLTDSGDGNEGEIQYVALGATGNRNQAPIVTQQTTFPMENWYEGEEDGANARFLTGPHQGVPLFAYREDQMGDELLLTIGVADDDESSDFVVFGHQVLAKIGTEVAGFFLGPGGRAAVDALSSAVQREIERGGERDSLGVHSVALAKTVRDGSTFGIPSGEHSARFERQAGKVWVKYTVARIADRPAVRDWCVAVTLEKVKIVDDSDDLTQGAGDVYIRARVADGYASGEAAGDARASQLDQQTTSLPANGGTRDVHTGHHYPTRNVKLFDNNRGGRCRGLPVFLYAEVDVFEDDSQADCSGRSCDDVLGVVPVMFTQNWLRSHPGSHQLQWDARGDSGKARVHLKLDIWDPGADPDARISQR